MNFNKAIIGGRITADPELRQSPNGTYICSFSVAVNRYKDEEADFFECTAFNERAELVSRNFRKGSNILVCGRLRQERFTDKDGNKRSKVTVTVDEVVFIDKKETSGEYALPEQSQEPRVTTPIMGTMKNGVYNPYAPGGSQASGSQTSAFQYVAPNDKDLPF